MTNHPLTHYPYERIVVSPLDKACDDQRDAFQESISEAHKLGRKTGRDEQLEQVMKWLDERLTDYSDTEVWACIDNLYRLKNDLKKEMRPTQENNS